ncbi:MAG: FAD-dependent tricarballylate dehydrogenase TcuA [SAR202 cluster bacterium]|nr:FAD-dependent tricarballylate dehydrogenase TcuA [SAR202 cluster bacterium]
MTTHLDYDVIVVGGGNAALSAALSARDKGAKALVVEKAPPEARGGNCPYTGGGFRFTHTGAKDLRAVLADPQSVSGDVKPYTAEQYRRDMLERTMGMTDSDLLDTLIKESYPTIQFLAKMGIQFERGGDHIRIGAGAVGSGPGLIKMHYEAARKHGVTVVYETKMLKLLQDESGAVNGVMVRDKEGTHDLRCKGVVLACGGFEANQEMRLKYLGGPWERAKVRGSKYNTGDGHRAALELGAKVMGQWTGCHATPIDADAPDYGQTDSVNRLPRRSYNFGITVNIFGQRFADEGEDVPLHTFVSMGRKILEQPRGLAFQIFDRRADGLLEDRYGSGKPVTAQTIEELASKLGIEGKRLGRTVEEFNKSVQGGTFDAKKLDGKSTKGLTPAKSNWAQPIDSPPFTAYRVTGGITYTFGGLKINTKAQVMDTEDKPIPGLYATGEIVGGFFYYDSLRASGLMHGAVFGRIGGANAAAK